MTLKLAFLGAVGTVTGSKYLLESEGRRVLIDCGLFQGFKQLRLRNWAPLPVDPRSIETVLLTHAHLDHSGYLPLLVKSGFKGPVISTPATRDLCGILLPDSGHLQEKDAEFASRHGFSKHRPALPLYTQVDGQNAVKRFKPQDFNARIAISGGLEARFLYAGHILGAAMIELKHTIGTILFSGDLGRPNDVALYEPARVESADYLIVESTYGDRKHETTSPQDALAAIIGRTAARGGTIVIPAFAVGRTQELLIHLHRLRLASRIPDLPVFLDSPMAIDASEIFARYAKYHRMTEAETREAFSLARYVLTQDDSKSLANNSSSKVIISASGMATGGRVLHHLKKYLPSSQNTIVFVGFQAGGTRGASLTTGAETVKIHGEYVAVRAEIASLNMLSAHADADEILAWLRHFKAAPRMTFITHGEPAAADALRRRIQEEFHWACAVPDYREEVDLA